MFVCECKTQEKTRPSQKIATAVQMANLAKYIKVAPGKKQNLTGNTIKRRIIDKTVVPQRHAEQNFDRLFK